jgi:hypothetical protein
MQKVQEVQKGGATVTNGTLPALSALPAIDGGKNIGRAVAPMTRKDSHHAMERLPLMLCRPCHGQPRKIQMKNFSFNEGMGGAFWGISILFAGRCANAKTWKLSNSFARRFSW